MPSTSLHSFLVGSWALSRSLHYSRGGASGMSARARVYLVCTCAYVWSLMRRESAFGRCLSAGSSSFDGHATFVPCLYYTESATEACDKARSWCTCSENWTCKMNVRAALVLSVRRQNCAATERPNVLLHHAL